jgi:hypothetical protein
METNNTPETYEPKHLNLWTMPSNYGGEVWPAYYVFLGRSRDSDDLTESNFAVGLERLGGESETVQVVREGHWACGWVEWIAIQQDDATALRLADEMMEKIESYPVLDENDYSEREMESANQVWKNCYDASERVEYIREHRSQFEFHDFADLLGCVRGKYFSGYASELLN